MIFDKFKGIREEREIAETRKGKLEFLIDTENEIIKAGLQEACINHAVQHQFYLKLKDDLLKKTDFSENDLKGYILARTNFFEPESRKALLAGIYSGCLLQLLTERNNQKGKKTQLYVNGCGSRFDYLFAYAHKIDDVIIENFTGNNICDKLASHKGKANSVILKNITGLNICSEIAHDHGKIKQVMLLDSTGPAVLSGLGEDGGRINQVVAVRINGERALIGMADHATVDQAIGVAITGNSAFYESASFGKISQLIGINICGEQALDWVGNDGKVSQLLYSNVPGIGAYVAAQEIICEETMAADFTKNKKITKAFELAKSMEDKDYPEIIAIAEQLYAIMCKK